MVAAFDFCLHGRGGAAPSIDTAMHGLVDAAHVDHLHPDAGIAIACAADGEALTNECFGEQGRLGAVAAARLPARPRHRRGPSRNPQAIGVVLGGHGITAWGETSEECEARSREIIATAQEYIDARGVPEPFGPVRDGFEPLPDAQRRARAAALAPVMRGLASTDRRQVGHFTDTPDVLDFLARESCPRWPRSARRAPTTSCAPRWRPLVVDLPADRAGRGRGGAAAGAARRVPRRTTPPTTSATPRRTPRRCAAPTRRSCSCPASACSPSAPNKQTARVAGEFYVNAINVMRGAEAVSTYAPIEEAEKFRIEYWALEEAKLQRHAQAQAAGDAGRVRHRWRLGHRAGDRHAAGRRGRLRRGRRPRRRRAPQRWPRSSAARHRRRGDRGRDRRAAGRRGDPRAALAFGGVDLVVNNAGLSISKPLLETTEADWDLQHDVMARRARSWCRRPPRG